MGSSPGNSARDGGKGSVSRLYLLRHAKAGWALPGVRDFDRPLDASGVADAETMGAAMRAGGHVPDLTLCSNARRCRETLEGIAGHADTGRVLFFDKLYTEDAAGYLALIHEHGSAGSLLIIGHNPMTEDLAMALAGSGDEEAREMLAHGFPTCGLAALRFEGGLDKAAPGAGHLEDFLMPANL
jgi:phosphohistidine phosphatase